MDRRPSIQEALDVLPQSRVHAGRWSRVGTYERTRTKVERFRRRGGAGLYVLAACPSSLRLVSGTHLRVQIRTTSRTIAGDNRWPVDRNREALNAISPAPGSLLAQLALLTPEVTFLEDADRD